jgi:predicted benzoate:H+ symporter BenE
MLRGIGAVVFSYVVMAAIVMIGSMAMLAAVVPGGLAALKQLRGNPSAMPAPTPRYLAMNLTLSVIAAIVGGWLVARMAPPPAINYVVGLACLTLVLGLVSAFLSPGNERQPGWYKVVITAAGVVGVLAGARLAGI